jgi:hypothetical protein
MVGVAMNPQGYRVHACEVLKHYTPVKNQVTFAQYVTSDNNTSAKSEIGFRKWTPRTDPSPHSPQIIRATYLQSSTMLRNVQ